jgi:hypothetical protein
MILPSAPDGVKNSAAVAAEAVSCSELLLSSAHHLGGSFNRLLTNLSTALRPRKWQGNILF